MKENQPEHPESERSYLVPGTSVAVTDTRAFYLALNHKRMVHGGGGLPDTTVVPYSGDGD